MASDVYGNNYRQEHSGDVAGAICLTEGSAKEIRSLRRFSVDDVGFFEGPEKLLEVWFDLCPLDDTLCDQTLPNGTGGLTTGNGGGTKSVGLRVFSRCVCVCVCERERDLDSLHIDIKFNN